MIAFQSEVVCIVPKIKETFVLPKRKSLKEQTLEIILGKYIRVRE